MSFDRNRIPRWRRGFRFQFEPAQNAHVLLYPEGMVKFNDSASEIGKLIDGTLTIAGIVARLEQLFPDVPELGTDVEGFMEAAHDKYWIDFT
ncbi:pyrroloquinoline quinone biosynthesis peptide chaperone PqqD [Burkholderia sp. HI2761]|uniref:pyrroloquinoline quinone biosynthesis peptide chaperone PqqD n=1 Tax=unclassified Burkholderia TaxID=2613784 RepID=UPI000B7A72AB|nr:MULTISPECIES: pyrroloquinoline quinone biosynthesis peptide chaperone PqqD [unclassified Burkholderia]MPV61449.1 pyrroloquinoline quinone biosynthesis peptide chaperone PqqD [Burkholderia sp. BE24]OXJ21467.1 pyrroloquinoline quinone biosynthesis peptide chaperone PqqD [Burkholderia sp. HI2761]